MLNCLMAFFTLALFVAIFGYLHAHARRFCAFGTDERDFGNLERSGKFNFLSFLSGFFRARMFNPQVHSFYREKPFRRKYRDDLADFSP